MGQVESSEFSPLALDESTKGENASGKELDVENEVNNNDFSPVSSKAAPTIPENDPLSDDKIQNDEILDVEIDNSTKNTVTKEKEKAGGNSKRTRFSLLSNRFDKFDKERSNSNDCERTWSLRKRSTGNIPDTSSTPDTTQKQRTSWRTWLNSRKESTKEPSLTAKDKGKETTVSKPTSPTAIDGELKSTASAKKIRQRLAQSLSPPKVVYTANSSPSLSAMRLDSIASTDSNTSVDTGSLSSFKSSSVNISNNARKHKSFSSSTKESETILKQLNNRRYSSASSIEDISDVIEDHPADATAQPSWKWRGYSFRKASVSKKATTSKGAALYSSVSVSENDDVPQAATPSRKGSKKANSSLSPTIRNKGDFSTPLTNAPSPGVLTTPGSAIPNNLIVKSPLVIKKDKSSKDHIKISKLDLNESSNNDKSSNAETDRESHNDKDDTTSSGKLIGRKPTIKEAVVSRIQKRLASLMGSNSERARRHWIRCVTSTETTAPPSKFVRKLLMFAWETDGESISEYYMEIHRNRPILTDSFCALKSLMISLRLLQQGPPSAVDVSFKYIPVVDSIGTEWSKKMMGDEVLQKSDQYDHVTDWPELRIVLLIARLSAIIVQKQHFHHSYPQYDARYELQDEIEHNSSTADKLEKLDLNVNIVNDEVEPVAGNDVPHHGRLAALRFQKYNKLPSGDYSDIAEKVNQESSSSSRRNSNLNSYGEEMNSNHSRTTTSTDHVIETEEDKIERGVQVCSRLFTLLGTVDSVVRVALRLKDDGGTIIDSTDEKEEEDDTAGKKQEATLLKTDTKKLPEASLVTVLPLIEEAYNIFKSLTLLMLQLVPYDPRTTVKTTTKNNNIVINDSNSYLLTSLITQYEAIFANMHEYFAAAKSKPSLACLEKIPTLPSASPLIVEWNRNIKRRNSLVSKTNLDEVISADSPNSLNLLSQVDGDGEESDFIITHEDSDDEFGESINFNRARQYSNHSSISSIESDTIDKIGFEKSYSMQEIYKSLQVEEALQTKQYALSLISDVEEELLDDDSITATRGMNAMVKQANKKLTAVVDNNSKQKSENDTTFNPFDNFEPNNTTNNSSTVVFNPFSSSTENVNNSVNINVNPNAVVGLNPFEDLSRSPFASCTNPFASGFNHHSRQSSNGSTNLGRVLEQLNSLHKQHAKNNNSESLAMSKSKVDDYKESKSDVEAKKDFKRKATEHAIEQCVRTFELSGLLINYETEIKVEQTIGRGGFAIVYRAKYRNIDVAVKELQLHDWGHSPQAIHDFRAELSVMKALHHPNILELIGACTRPNLCLISEYCHRGNLFDLLHADRLAFESKKDKVVSDKSSVSPTKVPASDVPLKDKVAISPQKSGSKTTNLSWSLRIQLALDEARGMCFLHTAFPHPLMHRDLKSLNLLITRRWTLKISDFGLSQFRKQSFENYLTGQVGTYHWMAPEVMENLPYNESADVFSFAINLWELASRRVPYQGMEPLQIALAVTKNGQRPDISDAVLDEGCPVELIALMKRCWSHQPKERPSFGEIIRDLKKASRAVLKK